MGAGGGDWRKIWRFVVFSTPDFGIGTDFLFFGGLPFFFTCAMEIFGEVANRRRRRKSGFPNSVFIVFVPNRGAALMPGSRCVCSQGIAELRVSSLDKVVLRGRGTATVLQILFGFSRCRFSFSRSGGLSFPSFGGAVRPPQTEVCCVVFPSGRKPFEQNLPLRACEFVPPCF